MHLKRWLTGIIAVSILVFLLGFGPGWLFCLFLYFISLVGLIEFYGITAPDLPKFVRCSNYVLTLFLFLVIHMRQVLLTPFIIVLWAFIPMACFMLTRHYLPDQQWTADIGKALLGPVYVVIPLAMALHIHLYYQNGNIWILLLITVCVMNDTGAFYFGKLFGKHKLHEAISPGKTWEGAVGGVLSSLIGGLLFLYLLSVFSEIDLHKLDVNISILVFFMSLSAQIGDLAESMLKRNHGVKDSGRMLLGHGEFEKPWRAQVIWIKHSGQIFPGHGGVLDRIDGIIFAIPVLYLYVSFCMV